jgi:hypothetical protein
VYLKELPRIQSILQTLNCLSRDVITAGAMHNNILVGCLDPKNLFDWHKDNFIFLFDREPRKSMIPICFTSNGNISRAQAAKGALQRNQQPFFFNRLTEIITASTSNTFTAYSL